MAELKSEYIGGDQRTLRSTVPGAPEVTAPTVPVTQQTQLDPELLSRLLALKLAQQKAAQPVQYEAPQRDLSRTWGSGDPEAPFQQPKSQQPKIVTRNVTDFPGHDPYHKMKYGLGSETPYRSEKGYVMPNGQIQWEWDGEASTGRGSGGGAGRIEGGGAQSSLHASGSSLGAGPADPKSAQRDSFSPTDQENARASASVPGNTQTQTQTGYTGYPSSGNPQMDAAKRRARG